MGQLVTFWEFTHNNRPHSSKGTSPFLFSWDTNPACSPWFSTIVLPPPWTQRLKISTRHGKKPSPTHVNTEQMMKERFKGHSITFKIGDKILLDATHLRISHGNKKLHPKRIGPLCIVRVINSHAYEIALPALWKGKVHPDSILLVLLLTGRPKNMVPTTLLLFPTLLKEKRNGKLNRSFIIGQTAEDYNFWLRGKGIVPPKISGFPAPPSNMHKQS